MTAKSTKIGTAPVVGYSGTPLASKLGLKQKSRFALDGAPSGFADTLVLPEGVVLLKSARGTTPIDVSIVFVKKRDQLLDRFSALAAKTRESGAVWIAWPKKSSGVATDVTESALREDILPTGWVDNKVCAIDDTWSGLRFVLRRALRKR